MKRYFLILLIAFITIQAFNLVIAAPGRQLLPQLYQPIDLTGNPKLDGPATEYFNLLFSPLGWSRDGKLAYITGIDPGGAGYEVTGCFRWVIQDMVNDQVLWTSPKGLEKGLPDILFSGDEPEIFTWVYRHFVDQYRPYFSKYHIELDRNLAIEEFPIKFNTSEYRGAISDIRKETKYDIPDIITRYKVIMARDGVKKAFGQYNDEFLMDVQMGGYIQSPFEPRIALVVIRVKRGWEGLPYVVDCSLVGAHLEKGY